MELGIPRKARHVVEDQRVFRERVGVRVFEKLPHGRTLPKIAPAGERVPENCLDCQALLFSKCSAAVLLAFEPVPFRTLFFGRDAAVNQRTRSSNPLLWLFH